MVEDDETPCPPSWSTLRPAITVRAWPPEAPGCFRKATTRSLSTNVVRRAHSGDTSPDHGHAPRRAPPHLVWHLPLRTFLVSLGMLRSRSILGLTMHNFRSRSDPGPWTDRNVDMSMASPAFADFGFKPLPPALRARRGIGNAQRIRRKPQDCGPAARPSGCCTCAESPRIATRLHSSRCSNTLPPRVKAFLMKSGADRFHCRGLRAGRSWSTALEQGASLRSGARERRDVDLHDREETAGSMPCARNVGRNRRTCPGDPRPNLTNWTCCRCSRRANKLAKALRISTGQAARTHREGLFSGISVIARSGGGEIAADTGLPLGTIKSRLRLALDRLRHAMR